MTLPCHSYAIVMRPLSGIGTHLTFSIRDPGGDSSLEKLSAWALRKAFSHADACGILRILAAHHMQACSSMRLL